MSWKKSMTDFVQTMAKFQGRYQAPLLLLLGIVTIILGYVGFYNQVDKLPTNFTHYPLDMLYRSGELFAFKGAEDVVPGNWPLEIARWLAPGVTLFALYQFIKALLAEQVQAVRMRFMSNHVIICGLGLLGPELIAKYRQERRQVVVIEKDPQNRNLKTAREMRAIVVIGDATLPSVLKKAGLHRARFLFAVTGDDGLNSEIEVAVRREGRTRRLGDLSCFVHIVDSSLCSLLRDHQLDLNDDHYALELFNVYQMAGQSVLMDHQPFEVQVEPPLTHLVIIGAGRMGRDLIFRVAKMWRETYGSRKKFKITVVDKEANARVDALKLYYPSIDHYCDLVPLQADLNSIEFRKGQFLFEDGCVTVTGIYVCMNDQSLGLAAALEMNQRLEDHAILHCERKAEVPIIVRTSKDGIKTLFEDICGAGSTFSNISTFPLLDRTFDNTTCGLNETIAIAIHDDYVRNQRKRGVTEKENPSIKPWNRLDDVLKYSNRNQAIHIRDKLRRIGCDVVGLKNWEQPLFTFEPAEIETLAVGEHERWLEERRSQGWKLGPKKDLENKISPYMVPYADLEEKIKELDRNAIRALPAVLARVDLRIIRLPKAGQCISAMENEITCPAR